MTEITAEIKVHRIIGRITHTGGNSVQKLSELENDTGYITEADVPKDLSELNNDTGYITANDIPPIPSKVSQLDIDITTDDLPEGNKKYVSATDKTKLNKIIITGDGTEYLADDGTYKPIDIPDTQIQSDWQQTDNTKKDFIKNKPTIPTKTSDLTNDSDYITSGDIPTKVSELDNDEGFITSDDIPKNLSDFVNDLELPTGIKVVMLERTSAKTVELSEEPYCDQWTGCNVAIVNTSDNRLYTAEGTEHLFPNINNANLTVDGTTITTSGEDFDNYVLAFYITDKNDGLAFQFKFMIFGMLSSSLLSGHFMTEISSLDTNAKTYVGAINELKDDIDNNKVIITELTYEYAITEKYKYTFIRDINGIITSVIKEEL